MINKFYYKYLLNKKNLLSIHLFLFKKNSNKYKLNKVINLEFELILLTK